MYEGLSDTNVQAVIMKRCSALLSLIEGERSFKIREL